MLASSFLISPRVPNNACDKLAAGMLGDLFSPGDFGDPAGGGGAASEAGGKPGIILPEFRPTGGCCTSAHIKLQPSMGLNSSRALHSK